MRALGWGTCRRALALTFALLLSAASVPRAGCAISCINSTTPDPGCEFSWSGFAYDFFGGSKLHSAIVNLQAGTKACLTASSGLVLIANASSGQALSTAAPSGLLQCPHTRDTRCRVHRVAAAPGLLAPYGLAALEACVAASLPGELADRFLAGPCMAEAMASMFGNSSSSGGGYATNGTAPGGSMAAAALPNITGPDLQRAVWWSPACMSRSPHDLKVFADAMAAALKASPMLTLNAMADFLEAANMCTSASPRSNTSSSCQSRLPESMSWLSDGGTSCSARIVRTLEGCCGNVSELNLAGTNTRGRLPWDFTLSRLRTDLSDNHFLCGTISRMPQGAKKSAAPPLPVLYNSRVQLDLPALERQYPSFVPHVISWLGNMTLSRENLAPVELDTSIAVTACELLRVNRLTVKKRRACRAKPFYLSWKHHTSGCYVTQLNLSISEPEQQRALREYNAYVDTLSTGLMCGPTGRSYRKKVVGATIGGALGAAVLWALIQIGVERILGKPARMSKAERALLPKTWRDRLRSMWRCLVHLLEFGALVYDEVSDWLFLSNVAKYGNLRVTIILGWLLVAKNFVAPIAQSSMIWMALPERKFFKGPFWTILISLAMVTPLGFCASATSQISKVHSGDVFCKDDSMYLFSWFLGLSVPGMLACGGFAVFMKWSIVSETDHDDPEDQTNAHLSYKVLVSIWFWLTEDIPQAVAQSVLWASGAALTTTTSYVMSGAPAFFNIFTFVFSFSRNYISTANRDSSPQVKTATSAVKATIAAGVAEGNVTVAVR